MSENQEKILVDEIRGFEKSMQDLVDSVLAQYESFMRSEGNVKKLLENVGEIPTIKRPKDEHKTDA